MVAAKLVRWLLSPRLRGWPALLCAAIAISLPTAVRAEVSGIVAGCEFTPYLPSILICAILLTWWQAAGAAMVSVAILGGLFEGSPSLLPCFVSAAGIFLGASAIIIATAVLIRRAIFAIQDRGADEAGGGIVFSLERGEVWASWYGQGPPMRLGSQRKVSEMMKDFLAQEELGDRLARR